MYAVVCLFWSVVFPKQPSKVFPISLSFVAKSSEMFHLSLKNQANRVLFGVCGIFLAQNSNEAIQGFSRSPTKCFKSVVFLWLALLAFAFLFA